MKLTRLQLKDFRQFKGRHSLEFSTDPTRTVTLIHAENSVGKTTLLNAVLWTLYEKLTSKFEQPKSLINFGAEQEGVDNTWVQVRFLYKGKHYQATRLFTKGRSATNFQVASLEAGMEKPLPNPKAFINEVVPASMAPYFFFDGENAEAFGASKSKSKVSLAIRAMLGFDLAKTADEDLLATERNLIAALKKLPGASEVNRLADKIEAGQNRVTEVWERVRDVEASIEAKEHQLAQVEDFLRANVNAKEIQRRRDSIQRGLERVKGELLGVEGTRHRWISQSLPSLVSSRLAQETLEFVDRESLKGRIPAPYNKTFVQGILDDQMCVCGRPVHPGTPHWGSVQSLLAGAANAELLSRVLKAHARIQVFKDRRAGAVNDLDAADAKSARLHEEVRQLEQKLKQANAEVAAINFDDVQKNETARKNLDASLRRLNQQLGSAKQDLRRFERELDGLKRELSRKSEENKGTRQLHHHIAVVGQARGELRKAVEQYEDSARKSIGDKVNEILGRVVRKDYEFRIDEDFGIDLLKHVEQVAKKNPSSSGEKQLLGLLFTAALCQFSRDRLEDSEAVLTPGTIAPLFLDSPLGKLDETYREAAAENLPQLADQVVLLLSTSQSARVESVLEPYVGKEYVLQSHNTAPQGSRTAESKTIKGRNYSLTEYDSDEETTKIVEVEG